MDYKTYKIENVFRKAKRYVVETKIDSREIEYFQNRMPEIIKRYKDHMRHQIVEKAIEMGKWELIDSYNQEYYGKFCVIRCETFMFSEEELRNLLAEAYLEGTYNQSFVTPDFPLLTVSEPRKQEIEVLKLDYRRKFDLGDE